MRSTPRRILLAVLGVSLAALAVLSFHAPSALVGALIGSGLVLVCMGIARWRQVVYNHRMYGERSHDAARTQADNDEPPTGGVA